MFPISNFIQIAVAAKVVASSGAISPTPTKNRWRNTLLLFDHRAKHLFINFFKVMWARYEIFLVFQILWIHVPKRKLDATYFFFVLRDLSSFVDLLLPILGAKDHARRDLLRIHKFQVKNI